MKQTKIKYKHVKFKCGCTRVANLTWEMCYWHSVSLITTLNKEKDGT